MYSESPIGEAALRSVLERIWDLHTAEISYEKIGYGSYHWSVTTADDRRWFVTADAHDSPFAVVAAYELSLRLFNAGLEFVRAPVAGAHGAPTFSLENWWLSVWPWVSGRSSTDHEHCNHQDLTATLQMVRRLHEHWGVEVDPNLVEDWAVAGREEFWPLVESGRGGLYAEEVALRAQANRSRIVDSFARYDELAAQIEANGTEFVITHGEPHAGNVVHTDRGPRLIDWDTAKWAPKERDLWSLAGYDGWLAAYGRDDISEAALEIYELQWTLSEIVDFARTLLLTDTVDADTEVAAQAIRAYLPV